MKIIKKYKAFHEAFLNKDTESAIGLIISNIKNKTEIDLYPYDELFYIQKGNIFLTGQLFLSLNTNKSIRINWIKGDLRSEIHSIDTWNSFSFESKKPDYTLQLEGNSIVKVLPEIVNFFKNPKLYITSEEHVMSETYDPAAELEEQEKKLKRARSADSRSKIASRIERLKASLATEEKVEKESDKITQDDLKIDVFKAIELYTIQVARGKSNSLIITGQAGVGKTATVIDTLKSIAMVADVHYYKSTGTATTPALYEILFKNRNRLVIFDDCDSVFKDPDSINILKGALDTYDVREISKHTKGNTFDSTGMSDLDIQTKWEATGEKILPNRFEFNGQVIFISNLPEDKFSEALISRSLHVDVHLNKQEIVGRMREVMRKMLPNVSMEMKEEALEYLTFVTSNYPVKFDLNLRTLIHSINLRAGNEGKMEIGGQEEFIWKLLVKKYLIRTKK
jgi:hypothetical protein